MFEIHPAEFHYNPTGVVHGGLALALLDSAMGCAVHSMLAAGEDAAGKLYAHGTSTLLVLAH